MPSHFSDADLDKRMPSKFTFRLVFMPNLVIVQHFSYNLASYAEATKIKLTQGCFYLGWNKYSSHCKQNLYGYS